MGVNAQVLAMIRSKTAGFMTDTCDIARMVSTVDEFGDVNESPDPIATSVTCRLLPKQLRYSDGAVALQERGTVWYDLSVPYDTDIQDGDVVTISSIEYQVLTVDHAHTDRADRKATVARQT